MASMGRLRALYGAQFERILAKKAINARIFHANQKGAFYGRILGWIMRPAYGGSSPSQGLSETRRGKQVWQCGGDSPHEIPVVHF